MSVVEFAKRELDILSSKDDQGGDDPLEDEMQSEMNKCLLEIVEVFANQEHSGFSASYAIGALTRLLNFEPLTPLTGEDDEWNDVSFSGDDTERKYQNKRAPSVFKIADGTAYHSDAIVFVEIREDGNRAAFTCRESRKDITFPYMPKQKKVFVNEKREVIPNPDE